MSARDLASSKIQVLNAILELLCYRIQLPDEHFKLARSYYLEVGEWLTKLGSNVRPYSPRVFHQGSMLLDTTVKPIGKTQFDLDAVCLLTQCEKLSPREVFDLVWKRLKESPKFKDIIRPKPRCIRIDLTGKFHIDVVPAVPYPGNSETSIRIPDAPVESARWKDSDPEGFAAWFEKQCLKKKGGVRKFSYNMSEAQVDPIPDRPAYRSKKPLKRAVQLIKRWRDKRFLGSEELSTPSIVITKLAADYYDGDLVLTDAVAIILDRMHARFEQGRPKVYNPVNNKELISEKWESSPESFEAFKGAIAEFRDQWTELQELTGAHKIGKMLTQLFGDMAGDAVQESFADIEQAKSANTLHVANGTRMLLPGAASASMPVKRHTHFGN